MDRVHFSVGDALGWGVKQFFDRITFFLLLFLVYLGVILATIGIVITATFLIMPFGLFEFSPNQAYVLSLILPILLSMIVFTMHLGSIKIAFDIHDHGKAEIKTLFSQWRLFLPGLVVGSLLYIAALIGAIFFIIPGLYIMARYFFPLYVLIDKPNTQMLDTFHESTRLTEGARWQTFGLFILTYLISCIPILIPIAVLAHVYAYRRQQENNAQLPPVTE